jgi:uncharacterized protein YciI
MKIYKLYFLLLLTLSFGCKNEEGKHSNENVEDALQHENDSIPVKPSIAELKKELTDKGFQVFDYVDTKTGDTTLMQQYFIAFLKRGPNRSQSKEVADSLQTLHMAHLGSMYEAGYADISGPFGGDGEIRGITIYNVPTLKIADSLANMDPMVKAGRLVIEIHPWWAAKGFSLR